MPLPIKWNKHAIHQLARAIGYIEKESVQNAEKVKNDLLAEISALVANPGKYNPDKYHIQNDGSFRAFELHRYRVSYRYTHKEIRIVRIRHTKRNPKPY